VARRQIRVFDPKLATWSVAQDSIEGKSNTDGPRAATIVPYFGDSTLFTEILTRDVSILDQNGLFARAIAPPTYTSGDGPPFPIPFPRASAMDPKGRLYARAGTRVRAGGV